MISSVTHREKIVRFALKRSVSEAAVIYSVARSTIYRWLHAFNMHGRDGLVPRSTAPHRPYTVLDEQLINTIHPSSPQALRLRPGQACGCPQTPGCHHIPHDHLPPPSSRGWAWCVPSDSDDDGTTGCGRGNVRTTCGNWTSQARTGGTDGDSGDWMWSTMPAGTFLPVSSVSVPVQRWCSRPCDGWSGGTDDHCRC